MEDYKGTKLNNKHANFQCPDPTTNIKRPRHINIMDILRDEVYRARSGETHVDMSEDVD